MSLADWLFFINTSYMQICLRGKILTSLRYVWGFQGGLAVKNPPPNSGEVRDAGLIPGSGRSPGGGHGNPLQYSCLENPKDRGTWQITVHRAAKSETLLKRLSMHAHINTCLSFYLSA